VGDNMEVEMGLVSSILRDSSCSLGILVSLHRDVLFVHAKLFDDFTGKSSK
jgi:hypothetical protein